MKLEQDFNNFILFAMIYVPLVLEVKLILISS